jgi:AAA domain
VLGVQRVALHEDNDDPGRERTAKLVRILSAFAKVRVVSYPDVPPGEDVTWWVEQGKSKAEVEARIAAAQEHTAELDEWDAGDDTELPPPREWLTAGQFCRTFLSSLVAPGATGKTALRILQAIAQATGKALAGQHIYLRGRVLILSFEDDKPELQRRILAACLYHKISRAELKGWLFLACPKGLKLMEMCKGDRVIGKLEPVLRRAIERRRPDLVIFDPFIKLHALEENDNSAMDAVADLLVQLGHEYNIAVDTPAHTHKGTIVAGDADARRGASAQRDAGRLDCTLIPMSEDEAKLFAVPPETRREYLRLDKAKVNLLPPARQAQWFRLISVPLGNATATYPKGDHVQTVEPWTPPEIMAGLAPETIAAVLKDIDAGLPNGQRYSAASGATSRAVWPVVQKHVPGKTEAQCREIIRMWIKEKVLQESDYDDPVERKPRKGLQLTPRAPASAPLA